MHPRGFTLLFVLLALVVESWASPWTADRPLISEPGSLYTPSIIQARRLEDLPTLRRPPQVRFLGGMTGRGAGRESRRRCCCAREHPATHPHPNLNQCTDHACRPPNCDRRQARRHRDPAAGAAARWERPTRPCRRSNQRRRPLLLHRRRRHQRRCASERQQQKERRRGEHSSGGSSGGRVCGGLHRPIVQGRGQDIGSRLPGHHKRRIGRWGPEDADAPLPSRAPAGRYHQPASPRDTVYPRRPHSRPHNCFHKPPRLQAAAASRGAGGAVGAASGACGDDRSGARDAGDLLRALAASGGWGGGCRWRLCVFTQPSRLTRKLWLRGSKG